MNTAQTELIKGYSAKGRDKLSVARELFQGQHYEEDFHSRRNHAKGENDTMAGGARRKMIKAPLSRVKDNFSKFIKRAGKEEIVITIHGRPAAVIIGFQDEDDWLEYRLLKDEKFLSRISESRRQYKEGKYKTLDELS